MNKIRYALFFLVTVLCFLIISENINFKLYEFDTNFHSVHISLRQNAPNKKNKSDFLNSSKKYNLSIIAISNNYSLNENIITIYTDDKAQSYIKNKFNINNKKYNTLTKGDFYFNFDSIKNFNNFENKTDYYIYGNKVNILQLKNSLLNTYNIIICPQPKFSFNHLISNFSILIWIILGAFIIYISNYNIAMQKKETFLKVSLGESRILIILKKILFDIVIFHVIFYGVIYLFSIFEFYLDFKTSLIMFYIIIFINSLMYLNFLIYDLKSVFSNVEIGKKLLYTNYIFKLIVIISTILLSTSNIFVILQFFNVNKEKKFFSQYKDYYYADISAKLDNLSSDEDLLKRLEFTQSVNEHFYRNYFQEFNATLQVNYSNIDIEEKKVNIILSNLNSLNYLKQNIKVLENYNFEKELYFIIHKSYEKYTEKIIDSLFEDNPSYKNYSYDVIYYDNDINLVASDYLDENYTGELLFNNLLSFNPIIAYDNLDYYYEPISRNSGFKLSYNQHIMYKIDTDKFNEFVQNFKLNTQNKKLINVWDKYQFRLDTIKKILTLNSMLTLVVFILQFLILSTIIKIEYSINSIELTIKKTLGYNIFEKNKKIILSNIYTSFLGTFISYIIINKFNPNYNFATILSGIITFIFINILTIIFIIRSENSSVNKILKGGHL